MNKKQKLVLHLLVWYFNLFYDNTVNLNFHSWTNPLTYSMTIVGIVVFYVNYFLVFPRTMKKGRYVLWLAAALLSMVFGAGVRYLIEEVIYPHTIGVNNYYGDYTALFYIKDNLHYIAPWVVISVLVSALEEWMQNRQERNELAVQSKTAELSFLKSQINPHFLFNSLNNIYSLAYKKSDEAPEAILKLSGIMRYMLEQSQAHQVPLQKELEYMHDYIALQQLRFKNGSAFTMEVHGDVNGQQIAPLLLISFVENIFKHGDVTDTGMPARVQLLVNGNDLVFKGENTIKLQQKDHVSGIGQQNVKRRLDLLYAGKYDLKIAEKENRYYSTLKLVLA
ncbi:sensor histidine kinase [Deminuibacter soli]|uniref:Histidine kinase n=1 Tax=Deminuibacter soli TaxID=2291815 RepID=A0A3E1NPL8_9BACT|nr:histidine kinase [Deminuibacter soli]RFM29889.1 histidine kinase [Deminuibacter soli]